MNQGLPKPLRAGLARQTAGDAHLSADALTAYVEHSLPQRESQRVTDHLAQCADCREVVFLASSAIEEPVGEEQELMPAAAVPRISPSLLAKTPTSEVRAKPSSRYGWRLRWIWVSAVAALSIVTGALFQRHSEGDRSAMMVTARVASSAAAINSQPKGAGPPVPESELRLSPQFKTTPAPQGPYAKRALEESKQAGTNQNLALSGVAPAPLEKSPSSPTASATPSPASAPPPSSLDALTKSLLVAPATHNGFIEGEAPGAVGGLVTKENPAPARSLMATRAATALHPLWRVTSDGHLERSTVPGGWNGVLADQAVAFHVVSVVGSNVWAGGSGGALFHSSDGGQSWSKQPLGSAAGAETGTILSIRFSDAEHGVVTTDGGAHWSTEDGGVSWTKE